jgi:hypothetical protein
MMEAKKWRVLLLIGLVAIFAQGIFAVSVPIGPSMIDGGSSDFSIGAGKATVESRVYHGYLLGDPMYGKYIYTYLVSNVDSGAGITFFNVALIAGSSAISADGDGANGGAAVGSAILSGTPVESVNYVFSDLIWDGQFSSICWFVSSEAPSTGNGGLIGINGGMPVFGSGSLLAPTPEPATLGLLAFGALAALRRKHS